MKLSDLLKGMDIPDNRRDITQLPNIKWLLRNLHVKNGDNEKFPEAIKALVSLFKRMNITRKKIRAS